MTEAEQPRRKKARNGAGSTRQRADGRWEHRLTLPNGKRKSVYGLTYTECRENVRELLKEYEAGRDFEERDPSVKDFLEKSWLPFVDDGHRAPSTILNYRSHINGHLVPTLGHHRLSKLTTRHIDQLLRDMKGKGFSPRTRQKVRITLRLALVQAQKWGMVSRNVADLSEVPKLEPAERTPLTPDQLKHFMAHTRDYRLGPLFDVAITTGMRIGEMLGLRWQDVDLERRTLAVEQALRKSADGKYEIAKPKTAKSRRVITLTQIAVDALIRQRENQQADREWAGDRWQETGLVFTSTIGTALDPPNVTHLFQQRLASAGLPRVRFHDLRHGAATLLALQRMPPNVIRDVLGHANVKTTLNTYTHTDVSEYRRAADAIDELLSGPPGDREAS